MKMQSFIQFVNVRKIFIFGMVIRSTFTTCGFLLNSPKSTLSNNGLLLQLRFLLKKRLVPSGCIFTRCTC